MRRFFATGVLTGDVSSTPEKVCARNGTGREDSKPGTSGGSESHHPSPDPTLELAPSTALGPRGELTETCVEHV
jgi:hypothetical protein